LRRWITKLNPIWSVRNKSCLTTEYRIAKLSYLSFEHNKVDIAHEFKSLAFLNWQFVLPRCGSTLNKSHRKTVIEWTIIAGSLANDQTFS
jgi:hypothetical protein